MPIPDDEIEWQFATFEWLMRRYGGFDTFSRRRLVLPTPEHFPVPLGRDHAYAERILAAVKGHAGMQSWPCRLEMMRREESIGDAMPRMERQWKSNDALSNLWISS